MAGANGNFIPIKPGEVRNPKGKPKGTLHLATRIRKIFEENIDWDKIAIRDTEALKQRYGKATVAQALVWVQVSKALTGDTQAFRALAEAGWGKMLNVDASTQVDVVHIYKPEKLEIAQIEQAAKQLRERAARAVEGELLNEVDSPTGAADLRPLGS